MLLFPLYILNLLAPKGDERTESLQDALRNEGSINKAFAEELDMALVVRGQFEKEGPPD